MYLSMWEYERNCLDNKLCRLEKASIPCASLPRAIRKSKCGSNDVGQEKTAAVGFHKKKVSGLDWAEGNREKCTLGPGKEDEGVFAR